MGVGHVSPCPLCEAREGHDVPGRQHRRARAHALDLRFDRTRLARLGECIAASFLERRGAAILGRNVRIGTGEIDLLAEISSVRIIAEVKTTAVDGQPIEDLTPAKLDQLYRLARSLRSPHPRIDFLGVRVAEDGAAVQWLPGVG